MATSVTSARVGRGEATIESSIWVAVIDGRASAPASAITCFWTIGTSSMRISMPRSPRATITQSAARTISSARCDRLRLLDLGDQRQPRVLAQRGDVLGAADERQRDEVDADLLARARRARGPPRARTAAPPSRRGCSGPGARRPRRRPRPRRRSRRRPAREASTRRRTAPSARYMISPASTVSASPAQVMCMRRASPGAPFSCPHTKRHRIAGLELGDPVVERPDAQLRPRQVLQDRDLAAGAAGRVAHQLRDLGVLLGGAVGEVQPGDIHPRLDHADQHLGVTRGGSDGRDDLRAAHTQAGKHCCGAWAGNEALRRGRCTSAT